jgi:phage terminase large subunit
MREDIFVIKNNSKVLSLPKLLGKGYGRGWFTNCPVRYRLFEGARSTKKSKVILGYEPIIKIISDERRNVVVCRKNDSDNRQSTFENICGCIEDMGFKDYFIKNTNPLQITYKPTGQKIIFRGLNNPTSLNSLTFAHGFLTDIYIEEAFELDNYADFRKLDGSLRGKMPDGLIQQITMCFNAWDGESWLYYEFFKDRLEDDYDVLDNPDITYMDYYEPGFIGPYGKGLYLHKSTYKINEFRDIENYDLAAKEMKNRAPEIYKVEFLGMFGTTTGKVYNCWNDNLVLPIQGILGNKPNTNFPIMMFADFAIGIDTGLSNGEGRIKTISKNENQDTKIKSATTMSLCAITSDYKKLVAIDEYFHSNNKYQNVTNTDDRENLTEPQILDRICETLQKWLNLYGHGQTLLMKGTINIYVDSEDIGFRQNLEIKLRQYRLYQCQCVGSTKLPIRTRVGFENLLMAYEDFVVSDRCTNLIREIKACKKGDGNVARADGNDHIINAVEYAQAPFYSSIVRWKSFKEH